ncbi:ferritin [Miniphocaeibacter massiliensis]|uniref:ferritin n=1 Tax=Miniphocaeibacter massiliensis TaxID=2041841 RepID=UPI000C1BE6DA|nr:ferritin [Miniphocaeibacter massiliensis]
MDNKNLLNNLNEQYNFELESAYIYRAMAHWCEINSWSGYANFLYKQEAEELEHADKLKAYLLDLGYNVKLKAIAEPKSEYDSLEDIFKSALEHEKLVTSRIRMLFEEARDINDYATEDLLRWYISEQVEEEASFNDIIERLERINGSMSGLYIFNNEMAARQ